MPFNTSVLFLIITWLFISSGIARGQALSRKQKGIISEQVRAAKNALIQGNATVCDSLLTLSEQLGKKRLQEDSLGFEILEIRGLLASTLENHDQAVELMRQAQAQRIRLYGANSVQSLEGNKKAVGVMAAAGRYREGVELARRVTQDLSRLKLEHTILYAELLTSLASIQIGLQDYQGVDTSLTRALKIFMAQDPVKPSAVASVYKRLGEVAYQRGDFSKALDNLKRAIEQYKLAGPNLKIVLPGLYYRVGYANFSLGQVDEGLKGFASALALAEEVHGEGTVPTLRYLDSYGQGLVQAGKPSEGIIYLRQAAKLYEEAPSANPLQQVVLLGGMGSAYFALEQAAEAEVAYQKGINILQNSTEGYAPLEYQLLYSLGGLYVNNGWARRALSTLEKARSVAENSGKINAVIRGELYGTLAQLYTDIGAYDQAYRTTVLGLDLLKTKLQEPHPEIGRLYAQLGTLRRKSGEYKAAIALQDRALTNLEVQGTATNDYLSILLALGQTYLKTGQLAEAKQTAEKISALANSVAELSQLNEAATLQFQGEVAMETGELSRANSFFSRALAIQESVFPDRYDFRGDLLEKIGTVELNQGAAAGAIKALQGAMRAYHRDPFLAEAALTGTYYSLAQAYALEDRIVLSKSYLDTALWAATQLPDYTTSPEGRRLTLAHNKSVLGEILANRSTNEKLTQEQLIKLFATCDYLKYDAVREQLRRVRASQNEVLPGNLWDKQRKLQDQLNKNKADLKAAATSSPPKDRQTILALRLEQEKLARELEAEEEQLRQNSPRYATFTRAYMPLDVAELQRKIGANRSLIEFFVTPDKVFLFTLNDGKLSLLHSEHDGKLDGLIDELLQGITGFYTASEDAWSPDLEMTTNLQFTETAHELYKLLIAPVAGQLKEQVVIVTDGKLGLVPFNALLQETVPETSLGRFGTYPFAVREHGFTRLFSGALLLQDTPISAGRLPAKTVLGMAPFAPPPTAIKPEDSALGFRVTNKDGEPLLRDLSPLPGSATEVAAITRLWGGDSFYEQSASRDTFLQSFTNYRILHLATHAQADETDGAAGFLAFRDKTSGYQRVYARDLYQYVLPTEMVFLSACETGRGAYAKGEGIVSLGRAFRYAGARSIFSTLWLLSDAPATTQLTIDFYQGLKEGLAKDVALRKTQLQYLNRVDTERKHPFFWAGIIGSGNMQSIR